MIRWLTEDFGVAPQLMPDDIPALAADGVAVLICNRPNEEVPPDVSSDALEAAATAAGLQFVFNPYGAGMPAADQIAYQRVDGGQRAVAYCASGTRSSVLWALSQAGMLDTDDILERTRNAGYNLDGLRSILDAGGVS